MRLGNFAGKNLLPRASTTGKVEMLNSSISERSGAFESNCRFQSSAGGLAWAFRATIAERPHPLGAGRLFEWRIASVREATYFVAALSVFAMGWSVLLIGPVRFRNIRYVLRPQHQRTILAIEPRFGKVRILSSA